MILACLSRSSQQSPRIRSSRHMDRVFGTHRFVPDHLGTAETFLLLDECPACGATVPITRLATLADLGAYLDTDDPDHDPTQGCPDEFPDDPAHRADCDFAHPDSWRCRPR